MAAASRLKIVDALRGFAVAQMVVYHFIYDLNYFGWVRVRMLVDAQWIAWRTAIVSQFLLLVGISLMLRAVHKPAWREFVRRWLQIAGAAVLVSAGSWLVFGPRFIWFGILHFVAIALLLARPLVRLGAWNLLLGAAALALGLLFADPSFNVAPFNAIGFVTQKPHSEDYVPLFPWIGVVLVGIGLGALWARRGFAIAPAFDRLSRKPPRVLVLLGRWPLTVYLLHQPLLMGALWLIRTLA
ncbi:MAG: heparan-alpha-glucosaminide N-acetyltransferase [Gemmatimonadota bacterium]